MAKHPSVVPRVADLRPVAVPAEVTGDRQGTSRHGASELLLVFGVAAIVLGAVMVSQGVLSSQSPLHRVPLPYAVPGLVERQVPTPDAHPVAMPPADRVPATPATRTALTGATSSVAACPPLLDLDHDLRLILAAMALHQRRTMHATPHVVPLDTQDVPAKDRALARAKEAVARGEASPPATPRPTGHGC